MRNEKNENIKNDILSGEQNIDSNKNIIINFKRRYKIVFSFLFYLISVYIIIILSMKDKKYNIIKYI